MKFYSASLGRRSGNCSPARSLKGKEAIHNHKMDRVTFLAMTDPRKWTQEVLK
jgi:hypothetical protein